MLIDFSVENSLSLKDEVTFSMISTNVKNSKKVKLHKHFDDLYILPTAVIYGFNASGKSNLIRSIENLKNQIVYSKITDLSLLDVDIFKFNPYRLDDHYTTKPTKYQIRIAIGKFIYDYQVVLDHNSIVLEKLLLIDENYDFVELIKRDLDSMEFDYDIDKEIIIKMMGSDKDKKLSVGSLSIFDERVNIFTSWIENDLIVMSNSNSKENLKKTIEYLLEKDELFYNKISRMLSDISYTNISRIVAEKIDSTLQRDDINESIKRRLYDELIENNFINKKSNGESNSKYTINTYKIGFDTDGNEKDVVFNLYEESEGTIKIYSLYAFIFDALNKGKTLIVDEMTSFIHPLISKYIIELFQNPIENINGQLITTTHTTDLLEIDSLRKDEIYITDKNFNETRLYSLADIIDVSQNENFRSAYLSGKYGGINSLRRDDHGE